MVKTLTLQVDVTADRVLHLALPHDVPDGPVDIVMVIVPTAPSTSIASLAGRWQTYFPFDFDVDIALHEIRHEWEQECPPV